jgi:hypothetical protein
MRQKQISEAMDMNSAFWNVAPCSLVVVYRRFEGTCGLGKHVHGVILRKTVIFGLSNEPSKLCSVA